MKGDRYYHKELGEDHYEIYDKESYDPDTGGDLKVAELWIPRQKQLLVLLLAEWNHNERGLRKFRAEYTKRGPGSRPGDPEVEGDQKADQ